MKASIRFVGRFLFVFLLLLILFSFAMFQGDFVSWFLFFGFLPIFLYQFGLFFYPLKGWKVTRKLSRHNLRAGSDATVKLMMKRRIPFPLFYCIVEEIFPQTLQKADRQQEKYYHMDQPAQLNVNRRMKQVIYPWFKRVIEIPYTIEQTPRGIHQLQAVRIRTGDVFGFLKKERTFQIADTLTVYPNERPLHLQEKFSNYQEGAISSHALNLKNTNVSSGVREYMPGDKISRIDWKQSARKNTMMTKEFEQEKSTDTLLVLNACYHEDTNSLAFEAAVEVTMSLMGAIHQQASQVGLTTIGEETVHFPLHHDMTQAAGIRQHLTEIQPAGERSFEVQLKQASLKIGGGFVLMIVTNHLDDPLKQTMKELKQRTKRIIIFYIQSTTTISEQDYQRITELQMHGIGVSILTEKQRVKNPIEVNVT